MNVSGDYFKYLMIFSVLCMSFTIYPQSSEQKEGNNLEKYVTSETMPHFPGGFEELMAYLKENINYPSQAKENDIEGEVVVQFWVDNEGKVHDVNVLKGIEESLNEEAKRLIYDMPEWVPAKGKSKRSKMMHVLSVNFRLDDVRIPLNENNTFNNNMLAY